MADREQGATDKLNLALTGIDGCLSVMRQIDDGEQRKKLIAKALQYTDEAHAALATIQTHLRQL